MLHGAKDRKVPVSVKAMQEKSYKRVVIREARPGETSNPCVKEGHDAVRAKYFLLNSGDVSLTVEIQCWGGLGDDGHRQTASFGRNQAPATEEIVAVSVDHSKSSSASHITSERHIRADAGFIYSFKKPGVLDLYLEPSCFWIAQAGPYVMIHIGLPAKRHGRNCAGSGRQRIWVP